MSDLSIEQGAVIVNGASLVVDHPNVKVWEVDLATKYAESYEFHEARSVDDDCTLEARAGVVLVAGARTLRAHPSLEAPTKLSMRIGDQCWCVLADVSRYTCRLVVYRR